MVDKDSIIISLEFVGLVLGVLSVVTLLRVSAGESTSAKLEQYTPHDKTISGSLYLGDL